MLLEATSDIVAETGLRLLVEDEFGKQVPANAKHHHRPQARRNIFTSGTPEAAVGTIVLALRPRYSLRLHIRSIGRVASLEALLVLRPRRNCRDVWPSTSVCGLFGPWSSSSARPRPRPCVALQPTIRKTERQHLPSSPMTPPARSVASKDRESHGHSPLLPPLGRLL